jgi:hypothetical protein
MERREARKGDKRQQCLNIARRSLHASISSSWKMAFNRSRDRIADRKLSKKKKRRPKALYTLRKARIYSKRIRILPLTAKDLKS